VYRKHETIVDTKTNEILAEYKDFYTNLKNPTVAGAVTLGDIQNMDENRLL